MTPSTPTTTTGKRIYQELGRDDPGAISIARIEHEAAAAERARLRDEWDGYTLVTNEQAATIAALERLESAGQGVYSVARHILGGAPRCYVMARPWDGYLEGNGPTLQAATAAALGDES